MQESDAKPAKVAHLAGPGAIAIRAISNRGPFASRQGAIFLPPTRVSIVNTGKDPVTLESAMLEPLRKSHTGERIEAEISLDKATPLTLGPGENCVLAISGSAPARAGLYSSVLRVTARQDAPLVIPVEIQVAAHAAWGIGVMAFGLLLAASLNLLDAESGVKGELGRVLRARSAANDLLAPSPAPPSLSALVENMNHNFDAAIETLQKPREPSFVDHRSKGSEEPLRAAEDTTASLRKILMDKPRRAIEVSDLESQWKELKESFDALSKRYLVVPPSGSSLSDRLGAFDVWAAERLLRPPIAYYMNDLANQITKVRLLYAAGRDADAALEAAATQRSMRRAANSLNDLVRTLTFYIQTSANDITSVRRTREQIETSPLPAERRAAISKTLDDVGGLLKGPFSWPMRGEVARLIAQAQTETLRAARDATLAAVEAARAQADREFSLAGVQAVIAEGAKLKRGPDGKFVDPKERIALWRRVLEAWRQRLATLPQPPPALTMELDALASAVDANDPEALRPHMGVLFHEWRAYSDAHVKTAMAQAASPLCLRLRGDLAIGLEATRHSIRLLEGNADAAKWEGALDRLRIATDATPDTVDTMREDCLAALVGLSGDLQRVRNEITSAMWSAAALPDERRMALANQFSPMLTAEAMANLASPVRRLRVEIVTPKDERHAERPIEIRIGNLAPNWGPGVMLRVDFGDGQQAIESAETLRERPLSHIYAAPKILMLSVLASESFDADGRKPGSKIFGEGGPEQLSLSPSPASLARQLSDQLFNLRSGAALLVAGLLYSWRFHARKSLFGAEAFDYAEAFALGFLVSLAVSELPQKLAELASLRG